MPSRDQFFAALGSLPAAVALLTALRWPDGLTCPHGGSAAVGGHGRSNRCRDLPRYRWKRSPDPALAGRSAGKQSAQLVRPIAKERVSE
jgi:hypothetical protein